MAWSHETREPLRNGFGSGLSAAAIRDPASRGAVSWPIGYPIAVGKAHLGHDGWGSARLDSPAQLARTFGHFISFPCFLPSPAVTPLRPGPAACTVISSERWPCSTFGVMGWNGSLLRSMRRSTPSSSKSIGTPARLEASLLLF